MTRKLRHGELPFPSGYVHKLGQIASVMMQSPFHQRLQIFALNLWTDKAILHEQCVVYFDRQGYAFAYACWAAVTDEVLEVLKNDHLYVLHPSEWNEGSNIWIVDFACRKGSAKEAVMLLREDIPSFANTVMYRRSKRNRSSIYRVV